MMLLAARCSRVQGRKRGRRAGRHQRVVGRTTAEARSTSPFSVSWGGRHQQHGSRRRTRRCRLLSEQQQEWRGDTERERGAWAGEEPAKGGHVHCCC